MRIAPLGIGCGAHLDNMFGDFSEKLRLDHARRDGVYSQVSSRIFSCGSAHQSQLGVLYQRVHGHKLRRHSVDHAGQHKKNLGARQFGHLRKKPLQQDHRRLHLDGEICFESDPVELSESLINQA